MASSDPTVMYFVLRLLAGLLVGFCVGLTGVGGGVLGMPVLLLGLNMEKTVAVGVLNAYGFISKSFAVYEHWRLKNIVRSVATYMLIGGAPTTVLAAFLLGRKFRALKASELYADKILLHRLDTAVGLAIGLAMLVAVVLLALDFLRSHKRATTLLAATARPGTPLGTDTSPILDIEHEALQHIEESAPTIDSAHEETAAPPELPMTPKRAFTAICLGAIFGVVIGATSVGGGVLLIPMMILFFRMSASHTVGTSVLVAAVASLLAACSLGISGVVDWTTVILMSIGSWLGVRLGSRLTKKMTDGWLKGAMIGIIALSTVMMFFSLLNDLRSGPKLAPPKPAIEAPAAGSDSATRAP